MKGSDRAKQQIILQTCSEIRQRLPRKSKERDWKKTQSWQRIQEHKRQASELTKDTILEIAWSSPTRLTVANATKKSTYLVRLLREQRWSGSKRGEVRQRNTRRQIPSRRTNRTRRSFHLKGLNEILKNWIRGYRRGSGAEHCSQHGAIPKNGRDR